MKGATPTPFDTVGAELALKQAQTLVEKAGVAPDSVEAQEAQEKLPAVPLAIEDYVKVRVDDQINFYSTAIERARKENARIVAIGRSISAAVVIFGALGAIIAKDWRDIWAPALGAAATLATAQNARAHHRFLIDSYSTATAKLKFAKTRWEVSPKSPAHDNQLIETVEAVLAAENAGWVQQMLLKPIVPDSSQQQTS